MKLRTSIAGSIGAMLLLASASLAQHVKTDYDHNANFGQYKTYSWERVQTQNPLWEDRIKKARAMGLNTVSVYIFWNQLEPAEGKFDWEGDNDIRRFVKLCQENGLWVALRPGPYVCAETEFGGYPAWLLTRAERKPPSASRAAGRRLFVCTRSSDVGSADHVAA